MRPTTILAASLFAVLLCAPPARGGLVSWSINSSQSQLRLAFPDQTVAGVGIVRVRNQVGTGNTWNVGNVAAFAGAFLTNYQDGPSPTLEFLPSAVGQFVGVDSGNYRPDLSTLSAPPNPGGPQYFGTSSASAVYGGRMRITVSGVTAVDGYFSFNNLSYSLGSGVVALDPLTGTFATNQTQFSIIDSQIGIDYRSLTLPAEMPDFIVSLPNSHLVNTGGQGTVSTPDPVNQPLLRQLLLPVRVAISLVTDGGTLQGTLTGTVVATAIVPEPGSSVLLVLGTIGVVSRLGFVANKRSGAKKAVSIGHKRCESFSK